MQLRPRQALFCERVNAALDEHGNTLGVAPTGAGKTVMLSAIVGRDPGQSIILQHRDELVTQNRRTFETMNPRRSTGLYTANRKEWGYDATFAMVQTLVNGLDRMPPVSVLAIDEGHHAAADTYQRIIHRAQELNPKLKLLLVTATPNRGDKKALRGLVNNCADQISLKELIDARHLVPPRTFVIDIGVREALGQVRRTISDFDMDAVAAIMDKEPLNERIVAEWQRVAANRQTVVFCSTVAHAEHVCAAFLAAGVSAACITDKTPNRDKVLAAYDRGEIQVVVNVAVLTEGWDHQPTSCVILLRPSSYKSTMIQMIGRGLRKVDPERYPGVIKDDCIVIDFGTSLLMHGGIEQDVDLDQKGTKVCPECSAVVPAQAHECPICGYEWPPLEAPPMKQCGECGADNFIAAKNCIECGAEFPREEKGVLGDEFVLTEIALFDSSPFKWEPLWGGVVWVASALEAWAMVVHYQGRFHAFGGIKGEPIKHLADQGERLLALAGGDDFLREHGDADAGNKARRWLHMPPSDRQLQMLQIPAEAAFGMTRYQASCHLEFKFAERAVKARLERMNRIAA